MDSEEVAVSNNPKVLVEFSPEEISWLADRLHEYRQGLIAAQLFHTQGAMARKETDKESFKEREAKIEEHKKMEAELRNRLVNKAGDQGFGDL